MAEEIYLGPTSKLVMVKVVNKVGKQGINGNDFEESEKKNSIYLNTI